MLTTQKPSSLVPITADLVYKATTSSCQSTDLPVQDTVVVFFSLLGATAAVTPEMTRSCCSAVGTTIVDHPGPSALKPLGLRLRKTPHGDAHQGSSRKPLGDVVTRQYIQYERTYCNLRTQVRGL